MAILAQPKAQAIQTITTPINIAASYQEAIIDCILNRIKRSIDINKDIKQIYVAGGVAANSRFRDKASYFSSNNDIEIIFSYIFLIFYEQSYV